MTIDTLREICRTLPAVTEDVKWGNDLCFCVSGKMFAVTNLDPPHSLAFKCTPDSFGELVERPGIRPAPYMARNLWVQEEQLGEALDRREIETLIRTSYELVVAKMPKSRRPGREPLDRPRRTASGGRATAAARPRRRAGTSKTDKPASIKTLRRPRRRRR